MTSLFESFDLMNNIYLSMNWLIMFIPFFLMSNYWLIPSRFYMFWNFIMNMLYNEFKLMMFKFEMNILLFISILIYIFILNFVGLFPYIFTILSHLSFSLSLSLSLWFSFMLFMLLNNYMKFLIHLVPLNTPMMLMNFMVMIEFISNMIRPLTLAIRLSANLMAGHLLMILLSNFLNLLNSLFLLMIFMILQNMLMILEMAVSIIQAYVFSMLLLLYFYESK
uniref:ATP synthase subunit a n=1 Tax=Thyreus decorus TaxID=600203 RepID=A0A7U0M7X1_9HYME|nr:ATP synthase F0 subunit 6 [Thyreus decorus]QQX27977.1 ATP synthase F0 subunit 6 [Thyreus decorus]